MDLAFGDERPGGPAKVAIAVATVMLAVVAVGLASSGGGDRFLPLVAVVPLYVTFVLWVLLRRRVCVPGEGPDLLVTRTLFGLGMTRRIGLDSVTMVRCRGLWLPPKGGSRLGGTPEGDARFIKFDLSLRRGWRGIHLDMLGDAGAAEAIAMALARRIGVPGERWDYVRREDGLPLRRRGARERPGRP